MCIRDSLNIKQDTWITWSKFNRHKQVYLIIFGPASTALGNSSTPPHKIPLSQPLTLAQAAWYWLKLGFMSFGGPAGQIAIMHHDLVEKKRWISEKRFLHALNYCMVLPGPEAQQLATYIGWLLHRTWGGILAGGLFVLPSFFILAGLA